jgi:hypothetical protein
MQILSFNIVKMVIILFWVLEYVLKLKIMLNQHYLLLSLNN